MRQGKSCFIKLIMVKFGLKSFDIRKNIFESGELYKEAAISKMKTTEADGKMVAGRIFSLPYIYFTKVIDFHITL